MAKVLIQEVSLTWKLFSYFIMIWYTPYNMKTYDKAMPPILQLLPYPLNFLLPTFYLPTGKGYGYSYGIISG